MKIFVFILLGTFILSSCSKDTEIDDFIINDEINYESNNRLSDYESYKVVKTPSVLSSGSKDLYFENGIWYDGESIVWINPDLANPMDYIEMERYVGRYDMKGSMTNNSNTGEDMVSCAESGKVCAKIYETVEDGPDKWVGLTLK